MKCSENIQNHEKRCLNFSTKSEQKKLFMEYSEIGSDLETLASNARESVDSLFKPKAFEA